MKRFCFGVTAVLLTSAFFTQFLQDRSLLTRLTGLDWKWQFIFEVVIAVTATFAGAAVRDKQ